MALVKWGRDGYGQLERNRVQTHNVESQCLLDATVFPNGAEVGSIVAVDKPNAAIKLAGNIYGLLANAEVLYDPMAMGLKNYHLEAGKAASVLFLEKGNTFTTNTIVYDNSVYANEAAIASALTSGTAIYAAQDSTSGQIALASAAPSTGLALQVVKKTTMPDGQSALKFIVINN